MPERLGPFARLGHWLSQDTASTFPDAPRYRIFVAADSPDVATINAMAAPLITLTTDFGLTDPSVAICKGVILGIVPDARFLDISHGVTRHAVAEGAALLRAALPYLPVGVHLAVVDPGVGTDRRPIALRTGRGDHLVGPDNGLLPPSAELLGGVIAAHLLSNPQYRLSDVSRTFQARDVFAPAAAYLASGLSLEALGPQIPIESLVRLEVAGPSATASALEASVALLDSFGNAQLFAGPADLVAAIGPLAAGDPLAVEAADGRPMRGHQRLELTWRSTYGEAAAGQPLLGVDSSSRLAIAVNLGSAVDAFGLAVGRRLRISRR